VVVAVPHAEAIAEPIAVIESFSTADAAQVQQHVLDALGQDYALGDVLCLKQLGLVDFPVNATHKIMRSDVQDAVLKYMNRQTGGNERPR